MGPFEKMTKDIKTHHDKLGQEIAIDDFVAFPVSNALYMGKVTKINPKMIKVSKIPAGKWGGSWNKYPQDLVKIESSLATLYCLKAE